MKSFAARGRGKKSGLLKAPSAKELEMVWSDMEIQWSNGNRME
jgi:hypothetical protein